MSRMASSLLLLKALWMTLSSVPSSNLASTAARSSFRNAWRTGSCSLPMRSLCSPTTAQKSVASVTRMNGSRLAGCGHSFITEVPASLRSW
ncbi:hypothetical protein BC831DRAFT_479010 [Entophlyctis helioformis]|nr:hypothetical protein BC831DRAFT_479010 [Entophlyctis helioformis]